MFHICLYFLCAFDVRFVEMSPGTPATPASVATVAAPGSEKEKAFIEPCLEDRLHALEILDLMYNGVDEGEQDEEEGGMSSEEEGDNSDMEGFEVKKPAKPGKKKAGGNDGARRGVCGPSVWARCCIHVPLPPPFHSRL